MRIIPGGHAAAVEATEEKRICSQLTSVTSKPSPTVDKGFCFPPDTDLPSGGRFDYLLQEGRSVDLCNQLARIFRNDPPVTCGETNGRTAGLSCNFKSEYIRLAFSPDAVVTLLYMAEDFWDPGPEGNLLELLIPPDARLVIVGDTHGQLEDVLWMFFKYGLPSATNIYLFNGDIVDRGGHALEILLLLFAFKRDKPNSMHILRGNHEDSICIVQYGFKAELESKFEDYLSAVWDVCCNVVFPLMPIGALVSDSKCRRRFFVVHGGIPEDLPNLDRPLRLASDLPRLERTRSTVQQHEHDMEGYILFNLLWADPVETESDREEESRADQYSANDVAKFCRFNDIDGIIRSHEVPETLRGVAVHHGGLSHTVFSASNYTGTCENRGGILICSGTPLRLAVSEHWAPPWKKLSEVLPFRFGDREDHRLRVVRDWEVQFGIVAEKPIDIVEADLEAEENPEEEEYKPPASHSAVAQELQFMAERITEHKDELFAKFKSCDVSCTGTVSKHDWISCMLNVLGPHCGDMVAPRLLDELFKCWSLESPVPYVRFLHRFQIRDDPMMQDSVFVDRIAAMLKVQEQLVDFSALNLEHLLDPDGDNEVTLDEFVQFLKQFHVVIPPEQAAALYETMSNIVRQSPLTLDSTILCLSLVSQDPLPESQWTELCEALGKAISKTEMSFPAAFLSWDTDRSGFLSLPELEEGLKNLHMSPPITHDQVEACMREMDSRGLVNNRVSIFEFVRAIAPRRMTMILQRSMIQEILKRVWRFRPLLLALLAERDPNATNIVSGDSFRGCLWDSNDQLERRGLHPLSQKQINAICEIAAAGGDEVRYDHFLRNLHVEDIEQQPSEDAEKKRRFSGGYDIRMLSSKASNSSSPFFWEAEAVDDMKKLVEKLDSARLATKELHSAAKKRSRST